MAGDSPEGFEDFSPEPPAVHTEDLRKKVTVYTDGACSGNPGPGGYGAVILFSSSSGQVHRKELSGGFRLTTNNRMEILSAIAALEALREPCEAVLYSDSQYLVSAVEKGWIIRWRKKNWMRNKTEPALNADLWKRLLPLLDRHSVEFRWVRGHAGNPENERCDQLARAAASGPSSLAEDEGFTQPAVTEVTLS
ncbi:MAG: ribonuclease HI [Clostridiales bacterium]|nr:ribonuclease HI [Clostridiales bacterium]